MTKKQKYKNRIWMSRKQRIKTYDRDFSVKILDDWILKNTISISKSEDITDEIPNVNQLMECGTLFNLNPNFTKISPIKTMHLKKFPKKIPKKTISSDPNIKNLELEDLKEVNVFATDSLISLLMNIDRTVYPWDIYFTIKDGKIFLDKRNGSDIDKITVNENSINPPDENNDQTVNCCSKLIQEASMIENAFIQQSLDLGNKIIDLPTKVSERYAPIHHTYNIWNLDNFKILIRSATNIIDSNNEKGIVHSLNEYDFDRTKWRGKIETQYGMIFAKELQDNSCKISRWVSEAYLANASFISIGFISRTKINDSTRHNILKVRNYKTSLLFKQLNLKLKNLWNNVKIILSEISDYADGKYIILKHPKNKTLVIYQIC